MRVARVWLSGFLLLGVLLGLLGSLVIAWQYQIDIEPQLIGVHFLALNAGYVIAAAGAHRLVGRISIKALAMLACGIAFLGLLALVFSAPPVSAGWRLAGLAIVGLSAGGLSTALIYALELLFEQEPAAAATRAGALFGCGCLLGTVAIGAIYFAGSVQMGTALLAFLPLAFLWLFGRAANPRTRNLTRNKEKEILRDSLRDLRSIATVLFSLLLFFQFGNEWAIAGWLPLFLIHRMGTNPVLAIGILAIYFLTLLGGRLAVSKLPPRVSHRRLLIGSVAAAVFGFLLLTFTASLMVAAFGVIVIGAGFAPIYPILAERLDQRFSFHPAFYSGATSIAITGAMSAPWLLGFVDASLGMRYLMLIPALGSLLVLLLSLLLMFEAHLMNDRADQRDESRLPPRPISDER
ncbi:MAG: MFS transporter [Acidobacteriota bacterium]|nr:MFS transporter [Acidobacteriota bacterium]